MIAGIGWPNGAVDNQRILALPGPKLLLSSEHWHVNEVLAHGQKVLYRIVPPPGKRPAELKWSPSRYVDMILEQLHGLEVPELIPWNELDLQDERGDSQDDFQDLPVRYSLIGAFGVEVIKLLRNYIPNTRLHWPAFTPNADHQAVDYIPMWRTAAEMCDIIDFHAYDTLSKVQLEHDLYKAAFPGWKLTLTEWHGKGSPEQEQAILSYLNEQELESYFFIYRWDDAPGWWSSDYDIEHNKERYDVFMKQGVDMPDLNAGLREYGLQRAAQLGLPSGHIERQFQQESGWQHWRPDGTLVRSRSGALGVCQIIPRWHPTVDVNDPKACIDYALNLMLQSWKNSNSYKIALMNYNWGPGNTNTWIKDGSEDDAIREETAHYLTVVLGPGWPDLKYAEWAEEKEPVVPDSKFEFKFGFKALAEQLGPEIVGQPLTNEEYFTADVSVQYTTTGKMEYSKIANKSYFFPVAQ